MNDQIGSMENFSADQLFVSDDEEDEDDRLNNQLEQARSANLGDINRHEEKEALLAGEQEEFHGEDSQFVKIIDKSRRAFSFSLDSTKSMQMSLKKPRNDCKNRCTRFRATLYALWILTYKHHGKPPGK